MSSEAIGGLYVAVGVDADPAITKIKSVSAAVVDAYKQINDTAKASRSLDDLAKHFDKVAKAAERAADASKGIKAGAAVPASPASSVPVVVRPAPVVATPTRNPAADLIAQQEALYARLQREREMDNKLLMESVISSAKARQAVELAAQKEMAAAARAAEQQRVAEAKMTQRELTRLHAEALKVNAQMDRDRAQAAIAADKQIQQAHADAIRINAQMERDRAAAARAADQEIQRAHAQALRINQKLDAENTANYKRLKREEAEAAKRAAKEEEEAKKRARAPLRAVGASSTELLTGFGAARSGNYFYGLAAASRGLKNVSSELSMLPVAARGAAVGVGAIAIAAVAAGAAVGMLGKKIAEIGFQGAADLQMLQIQFEGLLGSAKRAKAETDFLIALGKESIIPTQALMDADRQLLAFGVTADDTRRKLVTFSSDFGTATGKTAEQIYYLNLALGQVAAIGKANTIDLRQLANVGVSTADVYSIIGQKIGKSAKFVAENVQNGIITAPMLFAALDEYGKKFDKTADKAKLSTQGLLSNIKDQITFGLGQAFLGANSMVSKSLERVMELVKKIDFTAIGKSFEQAMGWIAASFEGIDWDGVVKWFNTWFPRAIKVAGLAIGGLIRYWRTLVGVVNYAIQIFRTTVETIIQGFVAVASAGNEVLDWLGIISDEAGQANRTRLDQMYADSEKTMADIEKEIIATSNDINAVWAAGSVKDLFVEVHTNTYDESQKLSMQRPTKPVEDKPFDWAAEFNKWKGANGSKSGSGGESPAEKAAKASIARMKELVTQAAAASEQLAQALIVPFRKFIEANGGKVQSAAEQAFSSMDYTTITTQFTDLKKALKEFYAPFEDPKMAGSAKIAKAFRAERRAQIASLEADVKELLKIAAQRDAAQRKFEQYEKDYNIRMAALAAQKEALTRQYDAQKAAIARQYDDYYTATSMTEGKFVKGALTVATEALDAAKQKYDEAKAKLDDLIAARDSFLEGVASSLRGYVNQLSMVTQEIQKYTRLDEAGSFSMTTEKKNDLAAWKQQLQERLDALKKYREQVAQLTKAGLNSDLLQSIVAAGPEQTSALVNELANATSKDIADINAVQAELKNTISGFQTEVSATFFDQGIAAQQAIVTPLKAALDSAQANVDKLTKEKEMALGILEAWYADQNAAIAAQEAKETAAYETEKANLEKFLLASEEATKTTAAKIQKSFSWLTDPENKKNTMQAGIAAMQGFIDGMDSQEGKVVATAKRIANAAASAIQNALKIQSPSRVMMQLGEYTTEGFIVGMENGMDGMESMSAMTLGALSASMGAAQTLSSSASPTEIKVFIGDKELTDIVDVQIESVARTDRDLVIAGRRY